MTRTAFGLSKVMLPSIGSTPDAADARLTTETDAASATMSVLMSISSSCDLSAGIFDVLNKLPSVRADGASVVLAALRLRLDTVRPAGARQEVGAREEEGVPALGYPSVRSGLD